MLSKNNRRLRDEKMQDAKQRFGFRKYSFGMTSVLLGMSFLMFTGAGNVSADTTDSATKEAVVTAPTTPATSTDQATVSTTSTAAPTTATSEETSTADKTSVATATSEAGDATSSTASSEAAKSEETSTDTAAVATSTAKDTSNTENKTSTDTTATSEAAKTEDKTNTAATTSEKTSTESATATGEATSDKASSESTTTSEASTNGTASANTTSETDQNASSDEAATDQIAKTTTLHTAKLMAAKVSASALAASLASTNTATTSDDIGTGTGTITDEGKAKGLTDSDIDPEMSDANGATVKIDNSGIPSGYEADPTKGRYTFGIVGLGDKNDSSLDTYNRKHGTNYYIRLSTNATGDDKKVYVQVVDADTNKVIWTPSTADGSIPTDGTKTSIDVLSNVTTTDNATHYYNVTYTETTDSISHITTRSVDINPNYGQTLIRAYEVVSSGASGPQNGSMAFIYPTLSTKVTKYIAKDSAGNETTLVEYDETGKLGQKFTISNSRQIKGYELVSSPDTTSGTLSLSYKVGDTYVRGHELRIANNVYAVRILTLTDTDGTATTSIYLARGISKVDLSKASDTNLIYAGDEGTQLSAPSLDLLNDSNVWKLAFKTSPIKPGEISNEGNAKQDDAHPTGRYLFTDAWLKAHMAEFGFTYNDIVGADADDMNIGWKTADGKLFRDANGNLITKNFTTPWPLANALPKGQESSNYYYVPQGQVRVNYVTSDGTAIKDPVTAYANSATGTAYDVSGTTYRPTTFTVNGKTYQYLKTDKSYGISGTTTVNGYTYTSTPSDPTGTIAANTLNDVYYVYELVKSDVTRTIKYFDKQTNQELTDLAPENKQTIEFTRTPVVDSSGTVLGYDTDGDGQVNTKDGNKAWKVTGSNTKWTEVTSPDLSTNGYQTADPAKVDEETPTATTADKEVDVYYDHATTPVKPGDSWPSNVADSDKVNLIKPVTRTIKYFDKKTGKELTDLAPENKQTVTFGRTAIVDNVTGKIVGYDKTGDGQVDTTSADDAWVTTSTNSDWTEVTSPDLSTNGYQAADPTSVAKETPTAATADKEVDVYYDHATTPVTPGTDWPSNVADKDKVELSKKVTRTITYLDKQTRKEVASKDVQTVTFGRTAIVDKVTGEILGYDTDNDGKVDVESADRAWVTTSTNKDWSEVTSPDLSSKGYEAPDKTSVAEETPTAATNDQNVEVLYDHATTPVKPGDNWPSNVADKDKVELSTTVTRTIKYFDKKTGQELTNLAPENVQKVTFGRTAIVDKVTGKVLGYDTNNDGKVDVDSADRAWVTTSSNKDWTEVTSPDLSTNGYQAADPIKVDEETPMVTTADKTVKVFYDHATTPVKPGDNWPSNVADKDKVELSKTVTRTIKYFDKKTHQELTNLAPENVQKVTFGRTAIVDKVTGEVLGYDTDNDGQVDTKSADRAWVTTSANTDWSEVTSPDLSTNGYQAADPIKVDEETPMVTTADKTVEVLYDHATKPVEETEKVTRTINYVDTLGKAVNGAPDGKSQYVQTVKFKRTAIVDQVTGEVLGYDTRNDGKVDTTDGDRAWDKLSASLDQVDSKTPSSVGYDSVDTAAVKKVTVVPTTEDSTETVVYSKIVAGKVTYIDKTTNTTLDTDNLPSAVVGTKINYTTADKIANYEKQGYKYVSSDFTDGSQTYADGKNEFTVYLEHATQTITPNDPNPVTPGQPINPDDPNSPVYPSETAHSNLVKAATQTVHYVDNKGNKVFDDKVQTDNEAFTRTVTIDKVTGKVLETSNWSGTKTFGTEDTPFKEGYHADKKTAGGLTATAEKPDVEETVIYTPNGKIVPVDPNGDPIPGAEQPPYTTDPVDPTKVVPNEPIPNVPGYTPVNPGDVTPTDPGKDTPVPYTKNEENKYGLTERFVDTEGNELLPNENKGTEYKTGDKYDVTKDAKVIPGYVLVDKTGTTGTFEKEDKVATFIYKKVGKIVPVDPEGNPIPGAEQPPYTNDPTDPSKVTPDEPTPDVPGYTPSTPKVTPEDPTKDTPVPYTKNEESKYALTEKFVDTEGNELLPNESKGTEYKTGDKYDVTKDSKVIKGYVLVKTADTTGTFEKEDKVAVFTYQKVGKLIPVDKDGNPIPGAEQPPYKNDPVDPSKVTPNQPIPNVPGYTPVDPSDVTPENPTEDTPVPYTKNEENKYGLTERFVDTEGNELSPNVNKGTEYKTGDKYDVTKDAKVIPGYVLVDKTGTTGTFEKEDKVATFIYKKVGKIIPVDKDGKEIPGAEQPPYKNDPVDPTKVVPDEPTPTVPGYTPSTPKVTPEDPTADTPVPYTKNEENKYGLTEKFVDTEGNELSPSVNKGTEYKTGDKYDVTKDSKVIKGYVLVKTTDTTGTFEKEDKVAVFTYQKVGKLIPVDKEGNPIPGAEQPPYKNDPVDPSKVTPNQPIPKVPGYTPVNPNPVTPTNPTENTPVPYTKNEENKYGLTEKFVDTEGNELSPNVNKGTEYKTGDKYDVTKDSKVITGYVLVNTTDTTGTFEKADKVATFIYKKVGKIIPVDKDGNPIPGADTPSYKNDPNDPTKVVPDEPTPDVPGYTPSTPKVTPTDPTKDTPVPYTKNETPAAKYGLTEKFVDENGKELVPSVNKGTEYKTGDKYDVTKDAKVIDGYVLIKQEDTTGTFESSDKTAKFIYKKVGKIIPVDKEGNPIPGADTPSYKNDPNDPSKVVPDEPTPTVPGYTPSTPKVTPTDPTKDTPVPYTKNETPAAKYGLTEKFVDENGKELVPSVNKGTEYKSGDSYDVTGDAKEIPGYKLVKTTDTKGTFGDSDKTAVFTYQKVAKYGLTEKFVDENGKELVPSVTKGTEYKSGDTYDVTGDAKEIPGYKLVKTTDTKGTFGDGDKTAVFTYQKAEKTKPGKKSPSGPANPGKRGTTAPTNPNTPGQSSSTEITTGEGENPLSAGKAQAATVTKAAQGKLPQTGSNDEQSKVLTGLGLAALAAASILGSLIFKKRKD